MTSRFALASLSCTVTIMSNKGLILYCTGVVERSHSACASFACFAVVPPGTGFLSPRSYVAAVLGQLSRPGPPPGKILFPHLSEEGMCLVWIGPQCQNVGLDSRVSSYILNVLLMDQYYYYSLMTDILITNDFFLHI